MTLYSEVNEQAQLMLLSLLPFVLMPLVSFAAGDSAAGGGFLLGC